MPMVMLNSSWAHLWQGLVGFVFYYPLFMSYLWMIGALLFYRHERKEPPYQQPPKLANPPSVSILVPCFNEGDNAEETLKHALALDYPDFEVIAINDGSTDTTASAGDHYLFALQ